MWAGRYTQQAIDKLIQWNRVTLLGLAAIWGVWVLPTIFMRGFLTALAAYSELPFRFYLNLLTLVSLTLYMSAAAKSVYSFFLGPLSFSQIRNIFHNLLNENLLLNLFLLITTDISKNPGEVFIWASVQLFYELLKIGTLQIKTRLSQHSALGLKSLTSLILSSAVSCMLVTWWLFEEAGVNALLLLNYEGFIAICQLGTPGVQVLLERGTSPLAQIAFDSLESLFQIAKWIHITVCFHSWSIVYPVQILIFLKIQTCIIALLKQYKRYASYKTCMTDFKRQYPPLSAEEMSDYQEEKCCICWELLPSSQCCKLSCSHVHHIRCLRNLILNTSDSKCPLCKQPFLRQRRAPNLVQSLLPMLRTPANINNINRVREVLPHVPANQVARALETTGSVNLAIDYLLQDN